MVQLVSAWCSYCQGCEFESHLGKKPFIKITPEQGLEPWTLRLKA